MLTSWISIMSFPRRGRSRGKVLAPPESSRGIYAIFRPSNPRMKNEFRAELNKLFRKWNYSFFFPLPQTQMGPRLNNVITSELDLLLNCKTGWEVKKQGSELWAAGNRVSRWGRWISAWRSYPFSRTFVRVPDRIGSLRVAVTYWNNFTTVQIENHPWQY